MRRMLPICVLLGLLAVTAEGRIPLYPGAAPGSEHWTHEEMIYHSDIFQTRVVTNVSAPSLEAFVPENGNGAAVVRMFCAALASMPLSSSASGVEITTRFIGSPLRSPFSFFTQQGSAVSVGEVRRVDRLGGRVAPSNDDDPHTEVGVRFQVPIPYPRLLLPFDTQSMRVVEIPGGQGNRLGLAEHLAAFAAARDTEESLLATDLDDLLVCGHRQLECTRHRLVVGDRLPPIRFVVGNSEWDTTDLEQVPGREEPHEGRKLQQIGQQRATIDQQKIQSRSSRFGSDGDARRTGSDHHRIKLAHAPIMPTGWGLAGRSLRPLG